MAYDKAVDSAVLDAGLTEIADAIRAKGGTTDSMAFPDGFAAAISALAAGGGGLTIGGENLHDTAEDTANLYLERGTEKAYSGWTLTGYIPVEANAVYALNVNSQIGIRGQYSAIYDAEKTYVNFLEGSIGTSGKDSFVLYRPAADGFLRFSAQSQIIAALKIYRCTGSMEISAE